MWQTIQRGLTLTLTATLLAGLLGQVVRDRWLVLFVPFYLPLLPLGFLTVLVDLFFRGRCFSRPRFGLALLGVSAALVGTWPLIGLGQGRAPISNDSVVRLLLWNVYWGGGPNRNEQTWACQVATMQQYRPDVIVLSEAPGTAWRQQMLAVLGSDWNAVHCEHQPGEAYWYNEIVAARWPVRLEYEGPIFNGRLMDVTIAVPDRPLRLLIVDGQSNPFQVSRVPMLADVSRYCQELARAGVRVDGLVGDFNTSPRSIAFDELATLAGGYRLTAPAARGWRGTWPALAPFFDIDHIWLHRAHAIHDAELFTNLTSDHRGQVVTFSRP